MRMEAASEVSALLAVETNWPIHIKAKLRLRKTANGDGTGDESRAALDAMRHLDSVGELLFEGACPG